MLLTLPLLFIGLFAISAYILYHLAVLYYKWRTKIYYLTKMPGPKFRSVLGVLSELSNTGEDALAFLQNMTASYPRVAHLFFGPTQIVVAIMHPEPMKTVMKTSEPKPGGSGPYHYALPWLGNGLLLSGGKQWARNRRLLTPAFHFEILKPYVTINNRSSDTLLHTLRRHSDNKEYFEVFSVVSLCTLEVILKCAFSYDEDVQGQGKNNPYVNAVQNLGVIMVHRALRPWLFPDWLFFLSPSGRKFKKCCDFVHTVSRDVIKRRKETLRTTQQVPTKRILDFLDILLTAKDENGKGLTDREIRDEVDTFLFEGHDTTASGISWTLYSLAESPEWQEKCREEIDEILEGRDSDEILWEDIPKLKVLTACIKETLRRHTPVPFIQRQTTKDMTIDGYHIPGGTTLDIHLYAMMHNTAVWDDPMVFKPERFMSDGDTTKDTYSFVPFSAGPRNCIGQNFAMHEMKVVVARVLRRFKLEVDPERPVKHSMFLVMKTEDGMYVKVSPRDRNNAQELQEL